MIRQLLIFLLLISFNANAIAGSVMMANMSSMAQVMMEKSEPTNHVANGDDYLMSMSNMSMDHCQSQPSTDSPCESDPACGLCMMHCSAALMGEITSLGSSPQFSFEPSYHVQAALSTHSRLLRPPKFA